MSSAESSPASSPADSPNKPKDCLSSHLQLPTNVTTRRTRTASTSARALENPVERGVVKLFSRAKGHGFITPNSGTEDLFVHISDVESDYVPMAGDEVEYRLCIIPPKYEKHQAVHVQITKMSSKNHKKWDDQCTEEGHVVH